MLEPIEKLFPNFLAKIREFPTIARMLLVVVILVGPAGLTWVYSHLSANIWLRRELTLVLAGTAVAFTIAALYLVAHRIRVRRGLRKFLTDWREFRSRFQLRCVRIDAYLIQDQKRASTEWEDSLKALEDLTPAVREYWNLRRRLRRDVFRVGESCLSASTNVRWESLKRTSSVVRGYATPFSFLLDRCQPIAEWNLHHDEIWEALYIADEFVEYLEFRHSGLTQGDPRGDSTQSRVERAWRATAG